MSWRLRSRPAPSWLVVMCRAGSPGSHARREQSVHVHGVIASRSSSIRTRVVAEGPADLLTGYTAWLPVATSASSRSYPP